jgi:hypothetical protein
MDGPIKTFDLSPEQRNTTTLIQRLLGKRIADRYVDFCRLAAGAFALRVSSPIAAHALRELESILRQTLEVPMDVAITPSQEQIERIEEAKTQLKSLGFSDDAIQTGRQSIAPAAQPQRGNREDRDPSRPRGRAAAQIGSDQRDCSAINAPISFASSG